MAEYRDNYAAFREAGSEVVALSVDDLARSIAVTDQLGLPYPLLCDPRRTAVRAWGLLNTAERGGIAYPACFIIDRNCKVRYRCVEEVNCRVSTPEMASYVRAIATNSTPAEPRKIRVRPGAMFVRAIYNAWRRGVRPSAAET